MGKKRVFDEESEDIAVEPTPSSGGNFEEKEEAPRKIVKAPKPLPPGYVCKACGLKDDHAIYNCPNKISKKEVDKKKSSVVSSDVVLDAATAAVPESSSGSFTKYVFVSGLPFEMTKGKLLELIDEDDPENPVDLEIRDIFIVTFKDNPSKCRGLAYITCHSQIQYNKCMTLNGKKLGRLNISAIESATSDGSKRKPMGNVELISGGYKKLKKEQGPRCYRCGGAHDPKTCENPRVCYKCRGTDHLSKDCPKKKTK